MKYKTLKNMERATRAIAAKGYEWEIANDIAIQCFENSKQSGMPVERFINMIISKDEHERGANLQWQHT